LDGDGDLDAFVANGSQGDIASVVWLNDGRGIFTLSEQSLGYGMGIELGDLDGDGDLDAFVIDWDKASEVWLNDGAGDFTDSGQRLGSEGGFDVALGDLDGDGDLDAFVAQEEANTVWLNDGDGAFSDTGQALGVAITAAVVLRDLDDDGDLDALAGGWDEPAKVWLNDGTGTFTDGGHDLSPASIHIHGLALGDVDGDGDLDAFMAIASGDPNEVWLNDGAGTFSDSGQRLPGSLGHGVSLGDLDGDGDLDAFVTHGDPWRGSSDTVWLNDGGVQGGTPGTFTDSGLRLGELASYAVGLGDLDNDGDLDAFVAHSDWEDTREGVPNQVWLNETRYPPTDTLEPPNLSIEAPQGNPATLDGILSPDEWDGARVEELTGGGELLLMHDDGYLYLGIRSRALGYGSICVAQGDQISILHSSAALGTAVFEKDEHDWKRTRQFAWCCRSLTDHSQREEHLQREGWSASIGYLGTPEEMEYQIAIPEGALTLAVVYQKGQDASSAHWWPENLDDDCLGLVLLPDNPPERLQFSPEKWMTIIASTTTDSTAPAALGDTWPRPADGMTVVYVPGGTFQMGSTDAEVEAEASQCEQKPVNRVYCERKFYEYESPQHPVTLDGFWMDRTEVTNARYALCVKDGDCRASHLANDPTYSGADYPVAGIPWQDAADYCAWAGGRLPTEAEWEYAARGTEGCIYPWGNEFDCAGGNFGDDLTDCDDGHAHTAPVARFPAGASWCGALDMAGNVWEWVSDKHGDYPAAAQTNPTGPAEGDRNVLRGGSWGYGRSGVRAAYRYPVPPSANYLGVGFRCVVVGLEE
jgi:formylglycine-generating enzyme required for sulfatase activity